MKTVTPKMIKEFKESIYNEILLNKENVLKAAEKEKSDNLKETNSRYISNYYQEKAEGFDFIASKMGDTLKINFNIKKAKDEIQILVDELGADPEKAKSSVMTKYGLTVLETERTTEQGVRDLISEIPENKITKVKDLSIFLEKVKKATNIFTCYDKLKYNINKFISEKYDVTDIVDEENRKYVVNPKDLFIVWCEKLCEKIISDSKIKIKYNPVSIQSSSWAGSPKVKIYTGYGRSADKKYINYFDFKKAEKEIKRLLEQKIEKYKAEDNALSVREARLKQLKKDFPKSTYIDNRSKYGSENYYNVDFDNVFIKVRYINDTTKKYNVENISINDPSMELVKKYTK